MAPVLDIIILVAGAATMGAAATTVGMALRLRRQAEDLDILAARLAAIMDTPEAREAAGRAMAQAARAARVAPRDAQGVANDAR
jgi:hypothetical protein